jgi:hypothetical protein
MKKIEERTSFKIFRFCLCWSVELSILLTLSSLGLSFVYMLVSILLAYITYQYKT